MEILIIDKSKYLFNRIVDFYNQLNDSTLVNLNFEYTCENALFFLMQNKIDFIFYNVDIDLAEGINKLKLQCSRIIIISKTKQFAYEAITKGCIKYLLRPVLKESLYHLLYDIMYLKLKDVEFENSLTNYTSPKLDNNLSLKFKIKHNNQIIFLSEYDISYFESEGRLTNIHLTNGTNYLASYSIRKFADSLKSNVFFRVHKLYYINILKSFSFKNINNKNYLVLDSSIEIPITVPKHKLKKSLLNFNTN